MPKFYIQDGIERTVLHADSALQACFRAIKHRFEGIPVNGFYLVSERGFENHEDDMDRHYKYLANAKKDNISIFPLPDWLELTNI